MPKEAAPSNAGASITRPPIPNTFDDSLRTNLQHTRLMRAITHAVAIEAIRTMTIHKKLGLVHATFDRKAMLRAIEDEILGLINANPASNVFASNQSKKKQRPKSMEKSMAGLIVQSSPESTETNAYGTDTRKVDIRYHAGNRTLH